MSNRSRENRKINPMPSNVGEDNYDVEDGTANQNNYRGFKEFDRVIEGASVWLFKNGYGVVERTLPLPKDAQSNQTIQLENPPSNPVHGTFWVVGSSNISSVNSIQTESHTREVEFPCLNIRDLLIANIGKNLDIYAEEGNEFKWISGTLMEIPKPQSKDAPFLDHSRNVLLLSNEEGVFAIPIHKVERIKLPKNEVASGKKLETSIKKIAFENTLSINYSKKEGDNFLRIRYLTNQITWAPSYYLRLSSKESEKNCMFSLKAVVLNDAESLNAKNVSLITGFPNMQFNSVIDPLSKNKQSVDDFLASLSDVGTTTQTYTAPTLSQRRSSKVMSNVMMQTMNSYEPTSSYDNNNNTQTSAPSDDLYVYTVDDISLLRKERTYIPIFSLELPYADVYHCEIDERTSDFQDVWHSVRIKNTTKSPWTTAPVTIDRGENFIGQDTSNYTPPGDETLINLTKAFSVKVLCEEKSESTKTKINFFTISYTIFTCKGQINITNLKNEEILLQLKRSLTGELKTSSVPPKSNVEKPRCDIANAQRTITWEVKVGAGKQFTIDYLYTCNKRF